MAPPPPQTHTHTHTLPLTPRPGSRSGAKPGQFASKPSFSFSLSTPRPHSSPAPAQASIQTPTPTAIPVPTPIPTPKRPAPPPSPSSASAVDPPKRPRPSFQPPSSSALASALASSSPSTSNTGTSTTAILKPATHLHKPFLLPSTSAAQHDPSSTQQALSLSLALLPVAFSPHKRKDRFLADGWAVRVRDAIVALHGTPCASTQLSDLLHPLPLPQRAEEVARLHVDVVLDAPSARATRVRGSVEGADARQIGVLLTGDGGDLNARVEAGLGGNAAKETTTAVTGLREGACVVMCAPVWDVEMADGSGDLDVWLVCARWRILE